MFHRVSRSVVRQLFTYQRLETLSVLSHARATTSSFLLPRGTSVQPVRLFSSQSTMDSSLSQILTEEIMEETSRNDDEIDEDYEDVKKFITSNFQLSEKVGYGEVILTRTFNDETITVKFDCQDEAEDVANDNQNLEDDFNNGQPQHHEVTEDDAEPLDDKFGLHFEVSIQKKSGDKAVFSCLATHQQTKILHISFISAVAAKSGVDDTLYGGPRYEDLDPAVQGGFQQYLAERGIDDDMSFFIIQHSRYKEEAEYLNWLKTLNDFVN
jgi:complement component 1 Q subcomponent-binding protein